MTALASIGLFTLFFILPFLTGNIYSLIFRKKESGIIENYLSGMGIIYAILFAIQLVIIKFKFDFTALGEIYTVLFLTLIVLGGASFLWRMLKGRCIHFQPIRLKENGIALGLIALQGVLYIVLKNPYFDNNALLETTKVTMETGTIYEYNAFTGLPVEAGFPLSNKLMVLPMLYAYLCNTFHINLAILFNFIVPAVTFISFYMIMWIWLQKLGKELKLKFSLLLYALIWIVQVGDGWSHSTAFRVLHTGYTGEAIFFGVLFAFALYMIKNRCYLISLICVGAFPGLVKYDTVIDFVRYFKRYYEEGSGYGGFFVIFLLAMVYFFVKHKKPSVHILNPNLTICVFFGEIWNIIMNREKDKWKKRIGGTMLVAVLLVCGNFTVISNATTWRNNMYGVPREEYELLDSLADMGQAGEKLYVMAHDELNRWIYRTDFDIAPVVGYDLGGKDVQWYSYEIYDEEYELLWDSVHNVTEDMDTRISDLSEKISMDYVIVKKITTEVPVYQDSVLSYTVDTPSYVVYLVDKN